MVSSNAPRSGLPRRAGPRRRVGPRRHGLRQVGLGRRVGLLGVALLTVAATGSWQFATAAEPAAEPTTAKDQLAADLDRLLDAPAFADGQASVLVTDAEGKTLYKRGADERLMPGSVTKLFSSTAALEVLGEDYRFETSVLAEASGSEGSPGDDGTINGDLYLKGGGDPTTLASDYRDLAEQLADAGIDTVRGDLVADDSWFDDERLNPSWTIGSESDHFAAQISALTVAPDDDYDAGSVRLDIRPGAQKGDPVEVELQPATSHVRIENRATTTAAGGESDITTHREHGTNRIVVTGSLAADYGSFSRWMPVSNPTAYAADVFARALDKSGIEVTGKVTAGRTPGSAERLAVHRSMPLGEMYVPFLKLSNNMHAEHLVKQLGREQRGDGSWQAGLGVVRKTVREFGVESDRIHLADGSGLGRATIVSSRQVVNLLRGVRDEPWFETWHQALPIAGKSDELVGGTLAGRMAGTPAAGNLHGKTGSLTGVSALAGYVTDADGERLMFSVLHNNHQGADAEALEDAIAVRLAKYSRASGAEQPAVRVPDFRSEDPSAGLECSWSKAC